MRIALLPERGWNLRLGTVVGRDTEAADHIQAELAGRGVASSGGSGVGLQVGMGKDLLSVGPGAMGTRLLVAAEASGGFLYQNDASSQPLDPASGTVDRQYAAATKGSLRLGASVGVEQEALETMFWRVDGIGGVDVVRGAAPYLGGRITAGSTDRKLNVFLQVDAVVAGTLTGDLRVSFGPGLTF